MTARKKINHGHIRQNGRRGVKAAAVRQYQTSRKITSTARSVGIAVPHATMSAKMNLMTDAVMIGIVVVTGLETHRPIQNIVAAAATKRSTARHGHIVTVVESIDAVTVLSLLLSRTSMTTTGSRTVKESQMAALAASTGIATKRNIATGIDPETDLGIDHGTDQEIDHEIRSVSEIVKTVKSVTATTSTSARRTGHERKTRIDDAVEIVKPRKMMSEIMMTINIVHPAVAAKTTSVSETRKRYLRLRKKKTLLVR